MFVAAYTPMFGHEISYQVVGPDLRVTHSQRIAVGDAIMLHDIAITETRALIFDLPVTLSGEALEQGYPLPYRWNADHAARVGVLPRYGTADDLVWCEVSPCYVYHPMNAYDLPDGRIVLDVCRHPKMFATDLNGPFEGPPVVERWTIDPTAGKVHEERLDDTSQEFPRVDERIVGRPHRYGYTAAFGRSGPEHRGLTKWDLQAGTSIGHDFGPGRSSGEGVFVPRTPDAAEDDGWVMSLVHDRATDRSELVVLDAQDFAGAPVATVHLPVRVPYGFHGNWVPTPS
jgi:carotenoid cleavage dioxygenase